MPRRRIGTCQFWSSCYFSLFFSFFLPFFSFSLVWFGLVFIWYVLGRLWRNFGDHAECFVGKSRESSIYGYSLSFYLFVFFALLLNVGSCRIFFIGVEGFEYIYGTSVLRGTSQNLGHDGDGHGDGIGIYPRPFMYSL